MKSTFKFVAVLAMALAFSASHAAAQGKKMLILKAPFAFTVENQKLPAGTYKITVRDTWLLIQTAEGKGVAGVLTLAVSGKMAEGDGRVVFHRYHDSYYLSEVWLPSVESGRQALESREERQFRKLEAPQAVVVQLSPEKAER